MSTLDRRLAALAEAVELADGRLPGERVDGARQVVARAGERLGLGVEATVVALAGPTGAGKSSLFNALAGEELVQSGRRRPMTSTATAAVWGEVTPALLDWLEVPRRHQRDDGAGPGLVLLDLPDFDSVRVENRLEVERLLALVDLVAWVVDPQKYADGALHDRYLRPLASHAGSMVLVLNQADLLSAEALAACRSDLAGLLEEDGLDGVPVFAVSARTGEGLDTLQDVLEERVRRREAATARLAADVGAAAQELGEGCGAGAAGKVERADADRLIAALGDAAGVPTVVRAVEGTHRRDGALRTGWPFVRWVRRLRPDPLRRLHLDAAAPAESRASLPGPSPMQRAQAGAATRALASGAAGDLAEPWPGLVRSAATARETALPDRLERAVAGAELPRRRPWWWALAGLAQLLLAVTAVVGGVWLLALALLGWLQLGDIVPTPDVEGFALPTVLLLGGLLLGLVLAFLARIVNGISARRRARRAENALRRRIAEVAQEDVIGPVEAELAVHDGFCRAVGEAAGEGAGRRRGVGARLAEAVRA